MKGNNPFHKIRVGNYRIVYEIQDDIERNKPKFILIRDNKKVDQLFIFPILERDYEYKGSMYKFKIFKRKSA